MVPRIAIAAAASGCGKTTFTAGLIDVFNKRGLKVQPFKVGPDYIDPMFHTIVSGYFSRNLDSWMLDENTVKHLFCKNSDNKDIAIIEGVMGLYDGFGGITQIGSTAHIAEITQSPVILLVNAQGMSLSVAAMLKGFKDFNNKIKIGGIVINRIKGEGHYRIIKTAIEENTGLRVLGYLPDMPEIKLESRHLGLLLPNEIKDLKQKISAISEQILKSVDVDTILNIANSAKDHKYYAENYDWPAIRKNFNFACRPKIAVAMDYAFNFYYRDNFDLLKQIGAEIIFFSPLRDEFLPADSNGIYIGGGYPEIFASELEQNSSLIFDIRGKIENGMPVYAECGGLMYMSQSISDLQGRCYEMVGAIRAKSVMTAKLQRFGYVEVETQVENIMSCKGDKIRAHEFHYSDVQLEQYAKEEMCYKVSKKTHDGNKTWYCGFKHKNLIAAYPHIHFWSNPGYACNFLKNCGKYEEKSKKTSEL